LCSGSLPGYALPLRIARTNDCTPWPARGRAYRGRPVPMPGVALRLMLQSLFNIPKGYKK
ncbi:MAG TPA: hypothetical protein PKD90_14305, partial [Phnomibacter sp.]|nr:hypothetical protein [Phnomibacter sp.]